MSSAHPRRRCSSRDRPALRSLCRSPSYRGSAGGSTTRLFQAWQPESGATLDQFNQYIQGLAFFGAPAIADVTGDGRPDILQGADSGALQGFDGTTGQPAAAFPKGSGGWIL